MYHSSDRSRVVPVQDWKSLWSPSHLFALASQFHKIAGPGDSILRPGKLPAKLDEAPRFVAGDRVRVCSAAEILSTLDMNGRLDGMPFLNGMVPLIGAVGTVLTVLPSAAVVLEFASGARSKWKTEWLAPNGPATHVARRAEEAAHRRLAALAADYPGA